MGQSKILFILKIKQNYSANNDYSIGLSTGLYNSAQFMNEMLLGGGFDSQMVSVTDNNDIDREVTLHKPTHVIIEALWVVPSKFEVLCKLHPNVKWIIRLHSEIPFLANEGMAMDWLGEYSKYDNVIISCNSPQTTKDIEFYIGAKTGTNKKIHYLPNFYPQEYKTKSFNKKSDMINVGCFGAVRPLKNHLIQAVAAVKFADEIGKKLHFHINSDRIEQKGEPILNNLISMFNHLEHKGHQLVHHEWSVREEFIQLCATMDIGIQVSFNETFNIVGADVISHGVPLVSSPEIPWANSFFTARQTNTDDITNSLLCAYTYPKMNVLLNQRGLKQYTNKTRDIWFKFFK
jgi:glycosyltransferase involved in cell wall biosynthesis